MLRILVELILGIPKTVYFNFRFLPFRQAVRFPVFIGHDTKIGKIQGKILFETKVTPLMVLFSWGGTPCRTVERKSYISVGKAGRLIFKGRCYFSKGVSLTADLGTMTVGDGFFCNRNCGFSCNDSITIGNDVMLGWNVEMLDSDNHHILYLGEEERSMFGKIHIGDHVWIAAYSHLLKGSGLPNGTVVAYRSLVTKAFDEERCLIGGSPAKVMRKNISWKR